MSRPVAQIIAEELRCREAQVQAVVDLLDGGATVPFIARYRKEATGGLDDTQLRQLDERLAYLRELADRREAVLKAIDEQGKLTPELTRQIREAETKQRLEDLYLPYKQKRRTKGQIAIEAGLEPLADGLLSDPVQDPKVVAETYVDAQKGVADAAAALEGARAILAERWAEDADLVGQLRDAMWDEGLLFSKLVDGEEKNGAKFSDYFEHQEPIRQVPSHRALAMLRGRREKVLRLRIDLDDERIGERHPYLSRIAAHVGVADQGRAADGWLMDAVRYTWLVKIHLRVETDLMMRLREAAEEEAIRVFGANLHDLLLAAPAGPRAVMGIDPGIRTGCKVAVVDATGKLLDTATIYPHEPKRQWRESLAALAALVQKHGVALVAIGNGTHSRETEKLVAELIDLVPAAKPDKIMVSEAGASVYSASELAAKEFPDLDVSLRGAVSIARRLQDPLAELVKIEPKAIGVGQYQHDVNQTRLAKALDGIVEDCVNAVGVDLNTASAPLLARVAGLNPALAEGVVGYRNQHGAFKRREELLKVSRFGDKTFEQAAGFLRIRDGEQPLDRTGVHPESYPVVERILRKIQKSIDAVMGQAGELRGLQPAEFTDEQFGEPTVRDILAELEKPGRDPRPEFKTASFKEGVETLKDLAEGMELEGVVTNVTNFGAFVDIGVHQDGLVHISQLADRFVKDPREVVKPGDVVKVRVMEVDLDRKRVGLSMRSGDSQPGATGKPADRPRGKPQARAQRGDAKPRQQPSPAKETAMSAAFAKLKG